jgi:beta-lactamase regulating signal transducer with metallopeptidase domain
VLTCWGIGIQSLLLVAAFYAWLAKAENRIRFSYLSILLTDWAILRLLIDWNVSELLWYMTVPSGTLLYIAQVDPSLRSRSVHEAHSPSDKEKRHILRSLATGLFCLTAIYQSDPSWWQGILTIALGFALIIIGLTLRVRAFLYIGTLTFIIKVLRQLWLFINNYSLLLWALGIVVGLIFIWIAATFEARRSQALALVQYWISELETWE